MPFVAALPAITSIASAASAGAGLYSALKGGSGQSQNGGGGSVPTGYQPTGQATADTQYQDLIKNLYGTAAALPGQVTGPAQQYVQNIGSNPYGGQSMDWAQGLAGLGGQVSGGQMGASQQAYGMGNQAASYGGQIMQTAFDPQNQMHDYLSQQTQDRTNAINAMNGVAGTPYGAGLASDASRNYEMDWQNQQLGRQVQGAGAYQGLGALSSNLWGQGAGLGNQAISSMAATGNVPYQTYMGQQTDALGGLGSLNSLTTGSMAPSSDLLTALGNYMGFGQNATRTAQAGQNTAFNQNQTQGKNLGTSITGMGDALKGLSGLFGSKPAAQAQTYSI